jgi:outer membrane receptor protein involved in Fe transport
MIFKTFLGKATLVLVLAGVFLVRAYAQVAGGALTGTVGDVSGAVIPDAQISLRNVATGFTRDMTSNNAGFFSAPNLLPGIYEVTISSPGFATQVRSGINLTVGAQQVLNITMQVGQVADKVEVTAEAPEVQLATSSIGAVVNSTTIRELPLNGRSWTDLATLEPGVAAIQTQLAMGVGASRGNRGFGDQIAVAGARPQLNNYRLDGISINDYSNGGPGSVLGGNLGVDAIQEFSVLTSNFSAEYGRTAGGVINAVSRSGTNQFHGGVYEFLRNSALDAPNYFDKSIPPFRRNQFGGQAGGAVRKDKLFVFGDYEGIRQSVGVTNVDTVPSVAARNGILCSAPDVGPCTGPSPIPGGVDPSAQKYLPFWPLPNGGIKAGTNGDIGIFTFAGQQVISENFYTTRVDLKLSEKDSFAATYLGDVTPFSAPDTLDVVLLGSKTNRQIGTLEGTHIFSPALLNSVRFGFSRDGVLNDVGVSAINPLAADPSLAAIPGEFASQVTVSQLTPFAGGVNGNSHNRFYWNSFQEYDDAFLTHGNHSLKFGGAVERMQFNTYAAASDPSGLFSFGTLSDFLTNTPKRFAASFADTLTARGFRQTLFGLYIQDDWRARSNLTINLGLRWEMVTALNEVQGKLVNLVNITDAAPHLGSPLYENPTHRNFEPRVGFAWDPFHNGQTAVRGGFGVFDILPMVYQFFTPEFQAYPFFKVGTVTNPASGSFFSGATSQLGAASNGLNHIEERPHRSYVMQWNLNVQRELMPNLTAMVGYVGSRGVHEPFVIDDLNIVIPTKTSAGYLFPNPVGTGAVLNQNFGSIKGIFYGGNSSYNALEASVQKKMSHGFQLQGSFTWAKSIDNSSSTASADQFSNSIASLPWYDLSSTRGLSDFSIGRTLVIDGTWQVPNFKSLSGPAAWIANGWELGAIYKVSDGVPFTATFGTDGDPQGINSGDPWAFPNRLTGPGCQSLVNPGNPNNYIKTECFSVPTAPCPPGTDATTCPFYNGTASNGIGCDPTPPIGPKGAPQAVPFPQCFNLRGNAGRNFLIGPGLSNLDFSVFKNISVSKISEELKVQFRAEFFNILNRANFAVPVTPDHTDIFDSTGTPTGVAGLLTSTTTTAREVQFALKLNW